MPESQRPTSDRVLYEKSVYLRVYSLALLRKAQDLRYAAKRLRNANAALVYDMQLIRVVDFFPKPAGNHRKP